MQIQTEFAWLWLPSLGMIADRVILKSIVEGNKREQFSSFIATNRTQSESKRRLYVSTDRIRTQLHAVDATASELQTISICVWLIYNCIFCLFACNNSQRWLASYCLNDQSSGAPRAKETIAPLHTAAMYFTWAHKVFGYSAQQHRVYWQANESVCLWMKRCASVRAYLICEL